MNFSEKLARLEPYMAGERPEMNKRTVKLNTNENPFPPSPKVTAAVARAAKNLHLYSDPDQYKLRQTLAKSLGIGADCVSATNGSDEALAFLTAGFCDSGMAFADVTYGFYRVLAALYEKATEIVPLKQDFTLNVSDYDGIKKTVFIANPNAPTGLALAKSEIERLVKSDPDRLVVVDEAYVDFGGESAISLIANHQNLAVVRTFSKSRSLAGARVGFVAANPKIIAEFERVRNSFNPYNVGSTAQAAAVAALTSGKHYEKNLALVIKNRAALTTGLRGSGFTVLESATNFVLASPPDHDGERLYRQFKNRGVFVRFFSTERLKEYCRITVGTEKQIKTLLRAVQEIYLAPPPVL